MSRALTAGGASIQTNWSYDTNANDRRLIGVANSGVSRSYTLSYVIPGGSGANNPYDVMSIIDTPASGHPLAGGTNTYTYDMSDRLTAVASYAGNSSYGYDPVDNATSVIIGSTQTQPTYNALNEIVTWGSESYSYDMNGNLLSGDGTRSYKWDAENRLIEIDYSAGGKSQFTYDGLGRRTVDAETASGGSVTTSYFLWCDDGHLCQVRDATDTPLRRDLSEGEFFTVSGQKLIYMPDQLGSARDLLDGSTGTLTSAYNYYPYGTINQHYESGVHLDYRFAGLFYHPASALNLGTYRAQEGVTGRFINRDPIGLWGGINPYEYTSSKPVAFIDTAGLCDNNKNCPPVPKHPSDANVNNNIQQASNINFQNWVNPFLLPLHGTMNLMWFSAMVAPGGPWDYKAQAPGFLQYDSFGNFNYGATGAALGIPLEDLQQAAGLVSTLNGTNYSSGFGPWYRPPFYARGPEKSQAIAAGYEYYANACYK